jgi:hypothetical protein
MAFRFETLEIWQMAKGYAARVYAITAKFPRHEDYGLKSQLNRAVNSIALNIAEGTAKNSSSYSRRSLFVTGNFPYSVTYTVRDDRQPLTYL